MAKKIMISVDEVALRKESVDRNSRCVGIIKSIRRSLSARRAWIEMIDYVIDYVNDAVALRKESVDRNPPMCIIKPMPLSRSPQGERG